MSGKTLSLLAFRTNLGNNIGMKITMILLLLIFSLGAKEKDLFYNKKVDYSRFTGRVTDRDDLKNVFKISSENGNIKFFRAGDPLDFSVVSSPNSFCEGHVRDVEKNYFVIYVKNLYPCWSKKAYFRRGTLLLFQSPRLAKRVREASVFREILIQRKGDYFKQLNNINNFIDSYDQHKILVAADFDKKIIELNKAKERAVESLLVKKKDSIGLQKELVYRLDSLDDKLDHYRVEKMDLFADRWHMDQDLGLPVGKRPQASKALDLR